MAITYEQMLQLLTGVGQMVVQAVQQNAVETRGPGGEGGGKINARRELDAKGYDNIEVFGGGEEAWIAWSWKMKVATRAMSEDLVDLMKLAEANHDVGTKEFLETFDGLEEKYDHKRCSKASAELYSVIARLTSMEAATVVKGAGNMDGVEAYGKLHANYSKRTLGRMFRVQRECMYPKAVKDLAGVKIAIMEWEEKWKRMKAEREDPRFVENVSSLR